MRTSTFTHSEFAVCGLRLAVCGLRFTVCGFNIGGVLGGNRNSHQNIDKRIQASENKSYGRLYMYSVIQFSAVSSSAS